MDIEEQSHLSSPALSMDCPFKTDIERFFPLTKPWKNNGSYTLIKSEQQYKDAIAGEAHVVCHFSEKNSFSCSMMDVLLSQVSSQYQGTRFLKISAEENPGLVAELNISEIPTLALIRDGEVHVLVVERDITDEDLDAYHLLQKILYEHGYIPVAPSTGEDHWEEEYANFDYFNC